MAPKLKFGFGQLNPVQKQTAGANYDPQTTNSVDVLKQVAADQFKPNSLDNIGGFRAICLRVELLQQANSPNSWAANVFGNVGENPKPLLAVRARIPEMHSALPDPLEIVAGAGTINQKSVDMHPVFIAADEGVSGDIPAPGDIINVDFGNRDNMSEGIYYGKVFDNPVTLSIQEGASSKLNNRGQKSNASAPTSANNYIPLSKTNSRAASYSESQASPDCPQPPLLAKNPGPATFPGAIWRPAKKFGRSKRRAANPKQQIRGIVLHNIRTSDPYGKPPNYTDPIKFMQWCQRGRLAASAHYFVFPDGKIIQMVRDQDVAWHTVNRDKTRPTSIISNTHAIGIEAVITTSTDVAWYQKNPGQRSALVKLVNWLCETYDIPKDYRHIIGHVLVDSGRRRDPGKRFPWKGFLAALK